MATEQVETTEREKKEYTHPTAKVIELVGTSNQGFTDAIKSALEDARQTTQDITGAEVQNMTVQCEDGEIHAYKVDLKVAFGVKHDRQGARQRDGGDQRNT